MNEDGAAPAMFDGLSAHHARFSVALTRAG
jgi:hypothetical protein